MTKLEYLQKLRKKLQENHINDIDEIINEYEEHFSFKLADGYSEEEIVRKLGSPDIIAEQYLAVKTKDDRQSPGKKLIAVTGLVFADIFAACFFIIFCAWVLVMAALTAASLAVGICLISGINAYSIIPPMPYSCAAVFALVFFALAVLAAAGTVYCAAFARQLMRSYGRFHRNTMASASGKITLPTVSMSPQFNVKTKRTLRKITLSALLVLAVGFIAAYVTAAVAAGHPAFWHVWGWFGGKLS